MFVESVFLCPQTIHRRHLIKIFMEDDYFTNMMMMREIFSQTVTWNKILKSCLPCKMLLYQDFRCPMVQIESPVDHIKDEES